MKLFVPENQDNEKIDYFNMQQTTLPTHEMDSCVLNS